MKNIYSLILAGGGGTRLWPLSREEVPKQFLPLSGGESLLRKTVKRLIPICGDAISIVAGQRWDSQISYQTEDLGLNQKELLIAEPAGRNTAPAIALGMAALIERGLDENTPILVCPSDHVIEDEVAFKEAIETGFKALNRGKLVTFGIVPSCPETGYGYIKRSTERDGWYEVEGFVEKPDRETAQGYLNQGTYYWNGGIFLFRMKDMLRAMETHTPELWSAIKGGYNSMKEEFKSLTSISIDYGIMEVVHNVAVVPLDAGWSDLGCWDSIYDHSAKDSDGNVISGDVIQSNCVNCLIEGDRRLIAAADIENLTIIDTADALYIGKRGSSQNVRNIVSRLKETNRTELWQAPQSIRHWGHYEILHEGEGVKVKKITVTPGKKLSLQYHHHRTEHWIVISGTAKVTRGEKDFYLHEGESTFIEKDQLHRLENPGKIPLQIIEVQNGPYLGEDDIVRVTF